MTTHNDPLSLAPDFSDLPQSARAQALQVNRNIPLAAKQQYSHIHSWSEKDDQAFLAMLRSDWIGLSCPSGRKAVSRLIQRAPSVFITSQHASVSGASFQALANALSQLNDPGSPFAISEKQAAAIARSCANSFLHVSFGKAGAGSLDKHRETHCDHVSTLIQTLIGAISPAARADLAGRVLPLYALKYQGHYFCNFESTRAIYAKLFAHGVDLNDIFRREPNPKASVSEQIKRILSKMPQDGLAPLFQAEFDRKDLSLNLSPAPHLGERVWDAKGLSPERLARLLNLVDLIEADHPGEGAERAISWLQTHPSAQSAIDRSLQKKAQPASSAPSSKRM